MRFPLRIFLPFLLIAFAIAPSQGDLEQEQHEGSHPASSDLDQSTSSSNASDYADLSLDQLKTELDRKRDAEKKEKEAYDAADKAVRGTKDLLAVAIRNLTEKTNEWVRLQGIVDKIDEADRNVTEKRKEVKRIADSIALQQRNLKPFETTRDDALRDIYVLNNIDTLLTDAKAKQTEQQNEIDKQEQNVTTLKGFADNQERDLKIPKKKYDLYENLYNDEKCGTAEAKSTCAQTEIDRNKWRDVFFPANETWTRLIANYKKAEDTVVTLSNNKSDGIDKTVKDLTRMKINKDGSLKHFQSELEEAERKAKPFNETLLREQELQPIAEKALEEAIEAKNEADGKMSASEVNDARVAARMAERDHLKANTTKTELDEQLNTQQKTLNEKKKEWNDTKLAIAALQTQYDKKNAPSTGGIGYLWYILGGLLICAIGLGFGLAMYFRKQRKDRYRRIIADLTERRKEKIGESRKYSAPPSLSSVVAAAPGQPEPAKIVPEKLQGCGNDTHSKMFKEDNISVNEKKSVSEINDLPEQIKNNPKQLAEINTYRPPGMQIELEPENHVCVKEGIGHTHVAPSGVAKFMFDEDQIPVCPVVNAKLEWRNKERVKGREGDVPTSVVVPPGDTKFYFWTTPKCEIQGENKMGVIEFLRSMARSGAGSDDPDGWDENVIQGENKKSFIQFLRSMGSKDRSKAGSDNPGGCGEDVEEAKLSVFDAAMANKGGFKQFENFGTTPLYKKPNDFLNVRTAVSLTKSSLTKLFSKPKVRLNPFQSNCDRPALSSHDDAVPAKSVQLSDRDNNDSIDKTQDSSSVGCVEKTPLLMPSASDEGDPRMEAGNSGKQKKDDCSLKSEKTQPTMVTGIAPAPANGAQPPPSDPSELTAQDHTATCKAKEEKDTQPVVRIPDAIPKPHEDRSLQTAIGLVQKEDPRKSKNENLSRGDKRKNKSRKSSKKQRKSKKGRDRRRNKDESEDDSSSSNSENKKSFLSRMSSALGLGWLSRQMMRRSQEEMKQRILKLFKELLTVDFKNFTRLFDIVAELLLHAVYMYDEVKLIIDLELPVQVVGDVHGNLGYLRRLIMCLDSGRPVLFLGDYVDRGKNSLQVFLIVLCWKLIYPSRIFALRGNHEDTDTNKKYGLHKEIFGCEKDKIKGLFPYKDQAEIIWHLLDNVYWRMPIVARISKSIMCSHGGGIPKDLKNFDDLKEMKKEYSTLGNQVIEMILWSDPSYEVQGLETIPNDRGAGELIGQEGHRARMEQHKFILDVRGHQCPKNGYEFFAGKGMLTIFGSYKYNNQNNLGSVLFLDHGEEKYTVAASLALIMHVEDDGRTTEEYGAEAKAHHREYKHVTVHHHKSTTQSQNDDSMTAKPDQLPRNQKIFKSQKPTGFDEDDFVEDDPENYARGLLSAAS